MHVEPYQIKIYYDVVLEAILWAGLDGFDPDINSTHFPSRRVGVATRDIVLVRFDTDTSPQEASEKFEMIGFPLSPAIEVATLCKDLPHLQERAPIIAVDPAWERENGKRVVICFHRDQRGRRADVVPDDRRLSHHSTFAAMSRYFQRHT